MDNYKHDSECHNTIYRNNTRGIIMIIQTVVMIFYAVLCAVLCAIADETIRVAYFDNDYLGSFIWIATSIMIEALVGVWIARGIFNGISAVYRWIPGVYSTGCPSFNLYLE